MESKARWPAIGLLILLLIAAVGGPWGSQVQGSGQGSAPNISDIDFPAKIQADGKPVTGLIFFEDPDGDVVKAKFELVEGDRSALQLSPGWEFDPGVKGQSEGVIEFQIAATAGGHFKLRAVLEDEAGNTSAPLEFAFEAVGGEQPSPPSQPCTVTIQPGQSIQEAIDAAGPGDVICLGEGEWHENLVIEKGWQSLTLRGAGRDRSVIKGKEEGEPVIKIESEFEIEVTLEDLTVTEAKGPWVAGILAGGKAIMIIRNSVISENFEGIEMEDSSQATISGSTISGNDYGGIEMEDSSQATISGSTISGNGFSIWMRYSSQATISGSTISGNGDGIGMVDSSQAEISDSQISGNGAGIWMADSSQAEIRGSRFLDNRYCGIWVETKEAGVRGGPNEMRGNGADLCGYAPASLRKPLVPQTEKTQLTVPGDYSSLQEAIDALAPGGTITVAPGTYEAGLTIWKPLTLRGAGKEETVLKPLPNPTRGLIVSIIAGAKGVALEGLTLTGSEDDGLFIYGEASLKGLQISGNSGSGIEMWESSRATISSSQISGNDGGIGMFDSSQATISGSKISGNRSGGIGMFDSSQATISGSLISGNGDIGIGMFNSSQATIQNNTISGHRWGIEMLDSSQATISGSTISGNGVDGISMRGSSQATISDSTISGNGDDGIEMANSSQATIRGNKIFENKEYGVALWQRPCFDTDEKFEGKVEGSGNEIHDNSEGDVCPEELDFLKTSQGGCYGPLCE